jgi:hypothetical protein
MEEFDWMLDNDILDSFIEGEYYSTGRWSMNSTTGYEYCGRSTSKADSNFGEEQLLFLMNRYHPCENYPEGRPSYFALSVSYIRDHMNDTGVTIDDLRQFTDKRDKSQFHN